MWQGGQGTGSTIKAKGWRAEPGLTGKTNKEVPPREEDRSLFGKLPPPPGKRIFTVHALQDASFARRQWLLCLLLFSEWEILPLLLQSVERGEATFLFCSQVAEPKGITSTSVTGENLKLSLGEKVCVLYVLKKGWNRYLVTGGSNQ